MKPLKKNVLVRRVAASDIETSGLILPESVRTPRNQGYVVAVGSQVDEPSIQPGVLVAFEEGVEFYDHKLDGVPYVLVPQRCVLAVLEKK